MRSSTLPSFAVLAVVGAALGVSACGSGDERFSAAPPFQNLDDVRNWAHSASALGVYAHAYEPFAFADGEHDYPDASCPVTTVEGTTVTIEGGCTDASGTEYSGKATIEGDADERVLTFEGFSQKDGTVTLRSLGASLHEFEVELAIGGVTHIDYAGTVEGDYGGRTVWNGSGVVERDGTLPPIGSVEATTMDQVRDQDVCPQPASGTTTLHARGDTAVITYDGELDCDSDQRVRLTVNGEERGELSGILCALARVGARDRSTSPSGPALVLLALAGCARRRVGWRPGA